MQFEGLVPSSHKVLVGVLAAPLFSQEDLGLRLRGLLYMWD